MSTTIRIDEDLLDRINTVAAELRPKTTARWLAETAITQYIDNLEIPVSNNDQPQRLVRRKIAAEPVVDYGKK